MIEQSKINDFKPDHPSLIWKHQAWFLIQITSIAEQIFSALDEKLNPKLFILGFGNAISTPLICQKSGRDDYKYQPEFFACVMDLASEIDDDKQARHFQTNPIDKSDRNTERISASSIKTAVERLLNDSIHQSRISYCSEPTIIGDYRVSVVLQLDATPWGSHKVFNIKWAGRTRLPASLVDSAAEEFLWACVKGLGSRNAGLDLDALGRDTEQIFRAAGRELTFRAALAGGGSMPRLFDALNVLASKNYEGARASGELFIINPDHPDLEIMITFKPGIELRDYGAARKVLEMAVDNTVGGKTENLLLLSTGHEIYGIGKVNANYDRKYAEVYTVRFSGHYAWDLSYDGRTVMKVLAGHPSLPQSPINRERFLDLLSRILPDTNSNPDALWEIITNASKQHHGTMIVISGDAAYEAARLAGQSTLIEPSALSPENLLMLTAIDGAVLIDSGGICHAVGVILDGIAVAGKGTRARGARYNSAIRYVDSVNHEKGTLVVVISEDGMINLMPDLMPRISRMEITENLMRVRAAINAETIDRKEYYEAMTWLNTHRFYLSEAVCSELNEIKTATKPKLETQNGMSITHADFAAYSEMNNTYFLD